MVERGWSGFGSSAESGAILPTGTSWRPASSSTKCGSCRILMRRGRPRLFIGSDTAQYLLGQLVVLVGAARARREGEDRLAVGGALLEAHALADHGLEELVAEHVLDLLVDVLREQGPP